MPISFSDQIKLGQALPLDSRQVVENLSEVQLYKYEGMIVFDKSDSKLKVCVKDGLDTLKFVEMAQAAEAPAVPKAVAKLGIAKVYGNNDDYLGRNCVSHGFIELYNFGDEPVSLEGLSLRIVNPKAALVHELKLAADRRGMGEAGVTQVQPGKSFLIRGKETVWTTYGDPMSVAVAEEGVTIYDAKKLSPLPGEILADQEVPELFIAEGMQIALVAANGAIIDTFHAVDLGKTKIAVRRSPKVVEVQKLLKAGNDIYGPKSSAQEAHYEVFRNEPVEVDTAAVNKADLEEVIKAVVGLETKTEEGLKAVDKLMVSFPISGEKVDEFEAEEVKVSSESVMTNGSAKFEVDILGTKVPMETAVQEGQVVKIAAPLLYLAKNPVKVTLKNKDFASAKVYAENNGEVTTLTAGQVQAELVGAELEEKVEVVTTPRGNVKLLTTVDEVESKKVKVTLSDLIAAEDKVMVRVGDKEELKALKVVTGNAFVEIELDELVHDVEHEIVLAVVKEGSIAKYAIKLTLVKKQA